MTGQGHTPEKFNLGYSRGPITGPTTPNISGPCCGGEDWGYEIITQGQETIAIFPNQNNSQRIKIKNEQVINSGRNNAKIFLSAVNAHGALVEALERAKECLQETQKECWTYGMETMILGIDKALALAKGGPSD